MFRLTVACLTLLALAGGCARQADAPPPSTRADIVLPRDSHVFEARVPQRATLAGLLQAHRVSEQLAAQLVDATTRAFDPRRIRAEQPYRLVVTMDGLVREFVYKIDADRFLRIVPGRDEQPGEFDVAVLPYRKERALVSVTGQIDRDHPSLVAALAERGETVPLAMSLADVFGGDIDFTNDLQPGDRFEVVFEKLVSEGEFAGYGHVLAATFVNDGRVLRAYRFEAPGQPAGYYDAEGRSLKRFFLRSPLKFEPRISSGFTYRRKHPVLGRWRAHPAIDYVAPVGAPVVAVAGGTVTRAGRAGGAGIMVTLRHNNGYESNYLHLSAVARGVRPGVRVAQGEVIGRVGSTGLSTGPHLDYRLKKNGAWVNPLVEHKKLPPGEPVPASARAAFDAARATADAMFIGAATVPTLAQRQPVAPDSQ
jgi:murein DD-endopeptidase MepM/ murein hydrolase activator NlpD